jgi:hypothetical protein
MQTQPMGLEATVVMQHRAGQTDMVQTFIYSAVRMARNVDTTKVKTRCQRS